jgi:superfamily II DNA or RNA helicase
MSVRDTQYAYTHRALERWEKRVLRDWEDFFAESALRRGRRWYADGRLSGLELEEGSLTVTARLDDGDIYAIIEWEDREPEVRDSRNDPALGQALAVAGLYQCEELLAERLSPLPAEKPDPTGFHPADPHDTADPHNSTNPHDPTNSLNPHDPAPAAPRPPATRRTEPTPTARPELLFFFRGGALCFRPPRDNGEGLDRQRERLIQLSHFARRHGFRFQREKGIFSLEDSSRFLPFLRDGLAFWEESFAIRKTEEVELLAAGQREVRLRASVRRVNGSGPLRIDWSTELEGQALDPGEIAQLLRQADRPTFLRGRGMVRLDEEGLQLTRQLEQRGSLASLERLPPYLFLSLFATHEGAFRLDASARAWLDSLRRPEGRAPFPLPEFLRPYQREGVAHLAHLCHHQCHPLLADEMGLGKTVQVLSLLHGDWQQRSCLVVCPASVVSVWQREAERFFPQLPVRVLQSGSTWREDPAPALWIASYSQLRRHRILLTDHPFHYAVLDEAQQIKNPDAKVSRACYAIEADHRLALTGTPIENSQLDLWSIFRFLMPDLLGPRTTFLEEMQRDPVALQQRVRLQAAPFLIRRTKKEVARELPDKVETEILCPLGEAQQRLYQQVAGTLVREFRDHAPTLAGGERFHFLTALTRLRQICCDARLLPHEFHEAAGLEPDDLTEASASCKLEALREHLEEILTDRRKVVLFSQFTSLLDRTEATLGEHFPRLDLYRLTGSTRDREAPVRAFQEHRGSAVLLASLKAGGTGITLHAADYVFLLDPWWNPAAEQQAIDRVHRIGQQKTVFVYRLIARHTIEANIQRLQKEKLGLFRSLVTSAQPLEALAEHFDSLEALLRPTEDTEPG